MRPSPGRKGDDDRTAERPSGADVDADKKALHHFGYAQQLLRDMGGFSNFAISFSIISILTGAVTLYGTGLNAGGPMVMGIGWPLVTIFVLFIAASMAELASAIPTSGALYHWSALLGGAQLGLAYRLAQPDRPHRHDRRYRLRLRRIPRSSTAFSRRRAEHHDRLRRAAALPGPLNHVGIRAVARLNDFSAVYHIARRGGDRGWSRLLCGQTAGVVSVYATVLTTSGHPYRLCVHERAPAGPVDLYRL